MYLVPRISRSKYKQIRKIIPGEKSTPESITYMEKVLFIGSRHENSHLVLNTLFNEDPQWIFAWSIWSSG